MQTDLAPREYRPTQISRRGELIAWGSFLLVGATWIVLIFSGQRYCFAVPVMAIILLLAALSISLGNWMDRQTMLRLDYDGVSYQNGIRNVEIKWQDIQEAQILPAQWGQKVHVIAERAHFRIQMLSEVKLHGEVKGQVGFAEGDQILQEIIERSNLHEIPPLEGDEPEAGVYYARE